MKYIISTNKDGTYTLFKQRWFGRRYALGSFTSYDEAKNAMRDDCEYLPHEDVYNKYGHAYYGYLT